MGLLYGFWFWWPLLYLAYLITVPIRRRLNRRTFPSTYWKRTVKFHAWWGVALSLPGLTIAVLGGLGDSWHWFGGIAIVATIGCWAVALGAGLGWEMPRWLSWMPLVTVVVSLNAFAALAGFPPEPGGDGAWVRYWIGLVMMSDLGLGLAAWLTVTICFALSVRRVNALRARASAALVTTNQATSGFVWPY
jgi:hypothetical protein